MTYLSCVVFVAAVFIGLLVFCEAISLSLRKKEQMETEESEAEMNCFVEEELWMLQAGGEG